MPPSSLSALPEPDSYQSYIVRIWRHQDAQNWRAFLHDLQTGDQINFVTFDEMLHYLFMRLAEPSN